MDTKDLIDPQLTVRLRALAEWREERYDGAMLKEQREEWKAADVIEAQQAEIERLQSDPNAVHLNLLRGGLAKPSVDQIRHVYPELRDEFEAQQAEIDRLREALRKLHAWSRPFVENTPISAETLWREFPKAIETAQAALEDTND